MSDLSPIMKALVQAAHEEAIEKSVRFRGMRMSSAERRNLAITGNTTPLFNRTGQEDADGMALRFKGGDGVKRRLKAAGVAVPTKAGLKREGAFARKRGKRMAQLDAPLERALARRVGTPVSALRTMRRAGNYARFADFEADIMRRADRTYRLK